MTFEEFGQTCHNIESAFGADVLELAMQKFWPRLAMALNCKNQNLL